MPINSKQKELIKIYGVLFAVIGIAMNWDSVSWLFNYRVLSGMAYDFFNPYGNSALIASANTAALAQPAQKGGFSHSAKNNVIEIPSIGVEAPIVIGTTKNVAMLEKDLNRGVVYYPGSVLPGQSGQIIILGHSAPPNWPRIKYDWVFTQINNLNPGDQIIVHFNNTKYAYTVVGKEIIPAGQNVPVTGLDGKNNMLTLVSCWPPGKNYKRITVQAQLAKNSLTISK